jgi:hypothetical protein
VERKTPEQGKFLRTFRGFIHQALCDPPLQSKSKGENAGILIIKFDIFDIFLLEKYHP